MISQILLKYAKKYCKTIHAETYYNTDVFFALLKYLKQHPKIKVFVVTPFNNGWLNHLYYPNMSFDELNKTMSRRVKILKEKGYEIGLHVHLSQMGNYAPKQHLIEQSTMWLRNLGVDFSQIQFGWHQNTIELRQICEKLNLQIYPKMIHRNIHDFNLI